MSSWEKQPTFDSCLLRLKRWTMVTLVLQTKQIQQGEGEREGGK